MNNFAFEYRLFVGENNAFGICVPAIFWQKLGFGNMLNEGSGGHIYWMQIYPISFQLKNKLITFKVHCQVSGIHKMKQFFSLV